MASEYTPEQLEAVNRINGLEDYYEILDVDRDATEEEITIKYKKLALSVHPDRNKSPGATQAFQKVGQAVSVLTDQEERNKFDEYGFGEVPTYSFHFENSDAERVFRDIFGDKERFTESEIREILSQIAREQSASQRTEREPGGRNRRPRAHPQNVDRNEGTKGFFICGSIVLIVLLWIYLLPDQLYSLEKTPQFRFRKTTFNLNVKYFVRSYDFHGIVDGSRRAFQDIVEKEYIQKMENKCHQEMDTRETMMWKARNLNDRKMFKRAHYYEMAACDELIRCGVAV